MKEIDPLKPFNCDINCVAEKISDFCFSRPGNTTLRPDVVAERGSKALYGLEAQEEVIKTLKKSLDGNFYLDYRCFHLLWEHKKNMYEKICYLIDSQNLKNELYNVKIKYKKIENNYNKIRMIYLKTVLADNHNSDIYGQLKNKDIINKLYYDLIQNHNDEKELLISFLHHFKAYTKITLP
jgi:hypothetical protein